MKGQRLYIFYSETHKYRTHLRLVNAYINRFCINEEYESEIIEIHQIEKLCVSQNIYFLPNFIFKFLFYAQVILSTKDLGIQDLAIVYFATYQAFQREIETNYLESEFLRETNQNLVHFIFGLPISDLAEEFLRSITEETTDFDFCFTFLNNRSTNIKMNSNDLLRNSQFTLNDDIELLMDQLKIFDYKYDQNPPEIETLMNHLQQKFNLSKSVSSDERETIKYIESLRSKPGFSQEFLFRLNIFSGKTESFYTLLKSDNSVFQIECERKSLIHNVNGNAWAHIKIGILLVVLLFLGWFIDFIDAPDEYSPSEETLSAHLEPFINISIYFVLKSINIYFTVRQLFGLSWHVFYQNFFEFCNYFVNSRQLSKVEFLFFSFQLTIPAFLFLMIVYEIYKCLLIFYLLTHFLYLIFILTIIAVLLFLDKIFSLLTN